jgi:DEAD/DEAH box helicase domain-containing protein
MLRAGGNVVVSTPTASGKTLVYNLPVLEQCLANPDSKALYLYPLKALAQDQLKAFRELTAFWPEDSRPSAAIYDGDTTQHFRKKIREDPPNVLMTNPEMLHLSLLPHHEAWSAFWAGLGHVVVDEAHTYRGVMGSHMAQVFRRMRRVCRRFGADPAFAFLSATVGNPVDLAQRLTGLEVRGVAESGAPKGRRHFLFVNPALTMAEGPAASAIGLLKAALHRGLRTIVYTQSRKMTELIAMWAEEQAGELSGKISAYRAGFLPEERREIEARMNSGELLAVVSTSALELGIDIGSLDLCILVGYPGTIMSTLQRGGRVGRKSRESAVVLVAGEDALDQYFMRNPGDFFARPPESAMLNPDNPVILGRHLVCAAAELPLREGEDWLAEPEVRARVEDLESVGGLLRDAAGDRLYSRRKRPHREVSLRGTGGTYQILALEFNGKEVSVGEIDEARAFRETHQGAIYIHRGRIYRVEDLDTGARTARVRQAKPDYYTRPRAEKSTEILEVSGERSVFGTRVYKGRLKVTDQVTGYEKRRVYGSKLLTVVPLDLPPMVFETDGIWFEIPRNVEDACYTRALHFMGGIHAVEHAAIGILPLIVMCDRNDLGGISTPMHEQVGKACVFVYDGAPGGVGLTSQAFEAAEELLAKTRKVIRDCSCELGCPSCVHSPKCGSGNRPIDKTAAGFVLESIEKAPPRQESGKISPVCISESNTKQSNNQTGAKTEPEIVRFGVLDVETRRSAQEVGGWGNAHKMGVSAAVLFDSRDGGFRSFGQEELPELFRVLCELDLVVGFNVKRFDYSVLSGASKLYFGGLPTLDMLEVVYKRLGYRLSLNALAGATLGVAKSADGLQALAWWKDGRLDKIVEYCTKDVEVTRDLYLYGRKHGHLLFANKYKQVVRVPVQW